MVPTPSFASSKAGTSAAEFLRPGAGARAGGMGGAYVAVADDASALFWNPAALARSGLASLAVSQVLSAASASHQHISYGRPLGRAGVLGVGVAQFSAGSGDRTDDTGLRLGQVTPQDRALSLGYAFRFQDFDRLYFLNGWSAGAAVKRVESRVVSSAGTVTADAGVLSPPCLRRWRFGASAANVGGRLRFGDTAEPLPTEHRLGVQFQGGRSWNMGVDVAFPRDSGPFAALGGEYARPAGRLAVVALRAGVDGRAAQSGTDGIAGVCAGLGVSRGSLGVDYAFRLLGNGWASHTASLSWGFGGGRGMAPPVRALVEEGQRLLAKNSVSEAVLKFNEALTLDPSCEEAREGLHAAAERLK